MNVILFGATGMVGQGVLRECLLDPGVERVLALPVKASYVFRPAYIQPLHGIQSRTRMYRLLYRLVAPLYPVLKALVPRHVTTTEQMGRAMLAVTRKGAPRRLLENADINAAAATA